MMLSVESRPLGSPATRAHRDLRRAWRRAAESWLHRQGLIEVSINQQTVTPFSPKMVP
jgi:hypothetical protein